MIHNLPLKILSVFLAFTVWFVVSAPRREPVSERAFAAPVSLVRMPRDLTITTAMPDTVSVRLSGRVSDLRALSSQNLEVTLDVNWLTPGDAVITLSPQAMSVPPQIDVVAMEPTKLRFHVEALRQKVVPIRPFLIGQPPPGYSAGDPTLVPDHVLISGPSSQVRNITEVATERIIMTGRTDTFVQTVAVVSDSSLIRIIEPLTTQATVPVNPGIGPVAPLSSTSEPPSEPSPDKKERTKGNR